MHDSNLTGRFTANDALTMGWSIFKGHYKVFLGLSALYAIYAGALLAIDKASEASIGYDPVGLVSSVLITPQLVGGIVFAAASAARGGQPRFADGFLGFRRIWTIAGMQLVLMVMGMVIVTPSVFAMIILSPRHSSPASVSLMSIVAFIASFLVLVWLVLRFILAFPIAIDPLLERPGVFQSLRMSWEATRGWTWASMLALSIAMSVLVLLCMLLLILPAIFFGLPLLFCAYGAAYAMLSVRLMPGEVVTG